MIDNNENDSNMEYDCDPTKLVIGGIVFVCLIITVIAISL